jgi:hypothetical protein
LTEKLTIFNFFTSNFNFIVQPDLYTKYLRSCRRKDALSASNTDIKSLMDKVDGINSKVEDFIDVVNDKNSSR